MFGWIRDAFDSLTDSLSGALPDRSEEWGSTSSSGGFADSGSDSFRFDNAYGVAADWQVPAEASSCFPSHELTTSTFGSIDSCDSWSSSGCGSSGMWD